MRQKIGMIGGGSWATAMVRVLQEHDDVEVVWWMRNATVAEHIARCGRNPQHLDSLQLDPARLATTTVLANAVRDCRLLFLGVPSAFVPQVLQDVPAQQWRERQMASLVKGFNPQYGCSITDYLVSHIGMAEQDVCVVSGASHAEEVAMGKDTFLTIASQGADIRRMVGNLIGCPYIHTVESDKRTCVEMGGLMKNVYAIAAGMVAGWGGGDNLTAALAAAAAAEMRNMLGGEALPVGMLSDLMVTCFSAHSRNRALGVALLQGETATQHFAHTNTVAEGYYSAHIMHTLPHNCPTPIADAVYAVLYQEADPRKTLRTLIDNLMR